MALQQTRAIDRRQRILDAALQVFSRRGYKDASVDEIAAVSGTSKGGVYFHFANKEAIFLALLDQTAARLKDKLAEALSVSDDPMARADAALLTVFRTFAKHRALARLFMVEALGAGREFHCRMAAIRSEFVAVIRHHLDEAVRCGLIGPIDTEVAALAWFGALNEVITTWALSGQPRRPEDTYAALRPILLNSVRAPGYGPPTG